jgi:hypothetical protein
MQFNALSAKVALLLRLGESHGCRNLPLFLARLKEPLPAAVQLLQRLRHRSLV